MKNIIDALLKFQNECPKVTKDSSNPYFKSKYADLTSIWETIQPILAKNGLVVVQPVIGMEVKTIIFHTSGEFIESTFPIVSKDTSNPQAFLSGVTYARRGALQSILSLVAEDDDGNAVSHQQKIVEREIQKDKERMGF